MTSVTAYKLRKTCLEKLGKRTTDIITWDWKKNFPGRTATRLYLRVNDIISKLFFIYRPGDIHSTTALLRSSGMPRRGWQTVVDI